MKNLLIYILTLSFMITSITLSAQLSDEILKQSSVAQAQRLQQFFNLSNARRTQIEKVVLHHEKTKGDLIHQSLNNLSAALKSERQRYFNQLSTLLTQSELDLYDEILRSDFINDRDHLLTLIKSFENDSSYIHDYIMFQNEEVLPSLLYYRSELDLVIKKEDKKKLNSIRNDIFDMFDNCLVVCLSHSAEYHDQQFESSNSELIVDINRELNIKESSLNALLALARKYESEIHEIRISNRNIFKKWHKRVAQIKDQHILPNHQKSFEKLIRKNDIASLRHIESDVILLLLDPTDVRKSRYFLNFGIHSQI